jgi:hypothetical protein
LKRAQFDALSRVLRQLDAAQIHHAFSHYRDDAISIAAVVPGERWEIDVLEDGEIDFERFVSGGDIQDNSDLLESIRRFAS